METTIGNIATNTNTAFLNICDKKRRTNNFTNYTKRLGHSFDGRDTNLDAWQDKGQKMKATGK